MLRLENIGCPSSLLVEEDELMSTSGKYDEIEAGMNFKAGVLRVGEVGELGGFEEGSLLEQHR